MNAARAVYAVRPWLVATLGAAAASFALLAVVADGPGRVLFWVAAACAAFETGRGALLRPTVDADENGVTVATGLRRQRFAWDEVERVGTLAPPSGGGRARRRADAVEIDLGERLLVVPRYRLGAPAAEVTEALNALGGGAISRPSS